MRIFIFQKINIYYIYIIYQSWIISEFAGIGSENAHRYLK